MLSSIVSSKAFPSDGYNPSLLSVTWLRFKKPCVLVGEEGLTSHPEPLARTTLRARVRTRLGARVA